MVDFLTNRGISMIFKIIWEFYVSAKSKDKCLKVVQKTITSLGIESDLQECERYWKDKSLFKVNLKSSLHAEDIQNAVFKVLGLSSIISRRWIVGSPQNYENGKWEFAGWASSRDLICPGISEASFRLTNF